MSLLGNLKECTAEIPHTIFCWIFGNIDKCPPGGYPECGSLRITRKSATSVLKNFCVVLKRKGKSSGFNWH